jgi:hypothetical protein
MGCHSEFDSLTQKVTIRTNAGRSAYYTLDGSDPMDDDNQERNEYAGPFVVDRGLIVKYWCEGSTRPMSLVVPPNIAELCISCMNLPVSLALALNDICSAGIRALRLILRTTATD